MLRNLVMALMLATVLAAGLAAAQNQTTPANTAAAPAGTTTAKRNHGSVARAGRMPARLT